MNKFSFSTISSMLFALLLSGHAAWASDIDPNAIDDGAWKPILAKQTLNIPASRPVGKGALMLANYGAKKLNKRGKEIDDRTFIIDRPYDLLQIKGLVGPQSIKPAKYNLSATMALLLEETFSQFSQVFPKSEIPIVHYYAEKESSDLAGDMRYRTITFGWFAFDARGTQLAADPDYKYINGELKASQAAIKKLERDKKDREKKDREKLGLDKKTKRPSPRDNDTIYDAPEPITGKNKPAAPVAAPIEVQEPDLSKLNLDAARQWALIRALLTQQSVVIEEIEIPSEARTLILNHAIKTRESDEIIQLASRVMKLPSTINPELAAKQAHGMRVKIGCSLRDKLLGCTGEVRAQDQEWLSNISSQVLQDAATKDQDTRIAALKFSSMLCAQNTNQALSQYRTTDRGDQSKRVEYTRGINLTARCNVVTDPQKWLQMLNGSKDREDMMHILRARVKVTPEWQKNFSDWFVKLDDDVSEEFLKTRPELFMRIDDPKMLPHLMQLLANRHKLKERIVENSTKRGSKVKAPNMINPALEGIIAYIAVADMPDSSLSLDERYAYWEGVVKNAKGKTKDQLFIEALARHKIKLSSKNMNEPANMNAFITGYVSLIQTQTPIALNIHAHLSKLYHAEIPLAKYNHRKKEWQNVGALNTWWKNNKMLYIPTSYASKFDYDSDSQYEEYGRLLRVILGIQGEEDPED